MMEFLSKFKIQDRIIRRTVYLILIFTPIVFVFSVFFRHICFSSIIKEIAEVVDLTIEMNPICFFGILIFCIFLGIFLKYIFNKLKVRTVDRSKKNNLSFSDIFEGLRSRHTSTFYKKGSFYVFILIAISVIVSIFFPSKFRSLIENPGGIFALVTGFFTLLGTFIAVQTILEMKRTITTYTQLLIRLTELIQSASDKDEEIKILCYFPLPGSWQVKIENVKNDLETSLRDKKRKIKIICLCDVDHFKFLLTIAKKRNEQKNKKISAEMLLDFQIKTENLLTTLNGEEKYPTKILEKENKKEKHFRSKPLRISSKDIPPYYFFVSDHRAIIVTPVGLPIIDDSIDNKLCIDLVEKINKYSIMNEEDDNTIKIKDELISVISNNINPNMESLTNINEIGAHVETLGFETTDQLIIQKLHNIFDDLENSKNNCCNKDCTCCKKILISEN
ncbi:MAG: hypothetical protein ACOYMD_02485 [Paludibacter sp.]